MPQPVILAQLKGFKGGIVHFEWKLTIKWTTARTGYGGMHWETPRAEEVYEGDAGGRNSEPEDLRIGPILEKYGMRGGNEINLRVEAIAGGKKYVTADIKNPFTIQGLNPALSVMLAELNGLEYEAIACHESNFNQFAPDANIRNYAKSDYPLQGESDASDFGIMQKNKPANDDIIWNWVTNVRTCKDYYDICYNNARAYLNSFEGAGEYDENGELLIEAFCQYNGGSSATKNKGRHYYEWDSGDKDKNIPGSWVRRTDGEQRDEAARDYGDTLWDLWNDPNWR